MESTATLILAFFIIAAKFVVVGCKKLRMPPVIGLIMLGLTAGHAGLDLAKTHDTILQIESFSEIGVIILLFLVGLETDIGQLKSMGKHSLFIACAGVIIPFVAGFGLAYSFTGQVDRSLLMGSILTATSVSVSVLTFSDLGRLAFVEAKMVITSAIIDASTKLKSTGESGSPCLTPRSTCNVRLEQPDCSRTCAVMFR